MDLRFGERDRSAAAAALEASWRSGGVLRCQGTIYDEAWCGGERMRRGRWRGRSDGAPEGDGKVDARKERGKQGLAKLRSSEGPSLWQPKQTAQLNLLLRARERTTRQLHLL